MKYSLVLVFSGLFLFDAIQCFYEEVKLPIGIVRGTKNLTGGKGESYYAFKGMRYAEPPQRFENSVPVKPWKEVYDATRDKSVCIQTPPNDAKDSEDCLFISVYTHKTNLSETGEKLNVMFWIHGGYFLGGGSTYDEFPPDQLLEHNVVVVTINYRLGLFGFASSGDSNLPGNIGMKDLILGLQWVQQYITYFGGNPKNVTIFGESAGAVLVSWLTQSALIQGKGYFGRAISQSGSTLNSWGFQRKPGEIFQKLASSAGCHRYKSTGSDVILKCLKEQSLAVLKIAGTAVAGLDAFYKVDIFNGLAFAPVIEPQSDNAAIVDGGYHELKSGAVPTVPIIFGGTSEEGVAFYTAVKALKPVAIQIDLDNTILVPDDMYASQKDAKKIIAPEIKKYYFNGKPLLTSSSEQITRFLSDSLFNRPLREILYLIRNDPTYCYVFSYSPKNNTYKSIDNVGHGEELDYIFNRGDRTGNAKTVSNNIVKLWTNFAKYGNPTPTKDLDGVSWPLARDGHTGTDVSCMNITVNLNIIQNPFDKEYKFWKGLYDQYGHPYDTYR